MTEDEKLMPESDSTKEDQSKIKERRERSKPLTKVVCRRLPPTMTEESFLEQVSPIPEYDYFYFVKPDLTLAPNIFSRAYFNFLNEEDIYSFRDRFDDYVFLDDRGNEYPAIVEYAPFQRLPKKSRKKDPKCGTIESDPIYLEFLESLKETDSDAREPKMEYSFQLVEDKKEITSTPLLEFLASRRKEERKRKEERQRRRPRIRNSKEDDIPEEDIKIKPREHDEKHNSKKESAKDDGDTPEFKDGKFSNKAGNKSYKEQRKASEELRKKNDSDKREFTGKHHNSVDKENMNRRDKREKRESPRDKERNRDAGKKFNDVKREKYKQSEKKPLFKQAKGSVEEQEQSEVNPIPTEKQSISNDAPSDKDKPAPRSLVSSKIKPFTQYTPSDISKVIEELDKNVNQLKVQNDKPANKASSVKPKNVEQKSKKIKNTYKGMSHISEATVEEESVNAKQEATKKSQSNEEKVVKSVKADDDDVNQQRRSSLESSEPKSGSDDAPLRRHKSLDDKSQDKDDDNAIKSSDGRKERRIRNKDRPSLVIYQPGMGKFSKQRMGKDKDTKGSETSPSSPAIVNASDPVIDK